MSTSAVSLSEIGAGIIQVTLDISGSSANVLTTDLFAELDRTFASLQEREDIQGLILYSAKPSIFVAGADLKRIVATLDWSDDEIVKFCEDGRSVMARLSNMPFITVAAIHGACVGGGLELTLWCDYRIASDHKRTILGLPEVKLGLVPGWAGTVRLPRIANLEAAIDLVTSGRVANAKEALAMGVVDQVVPQDELLRAATQMIEDESFESSENIRGSVLGVVERAGDIETLRNEFSTRIASNPAIFPMACHVVLEHLLDTVDKDHAAACRSESLAMAAVYGSEPSYGLLNHYFLGEHNRKHPGLDDPKLTGPEIKHVGIVGSGVMGTSIAESCLKSGFEVTLFDASPEALNSSIELLSPVAIAKGVKCHAAAGYDAFGECDLVIESVVEVAEIKKTVLEKIESAVGDQAMIATNTSAIPLAKLSGVLSRPERFCGIHFCHPQLMQLVEVVRGAWTAESELGSVVAWIRRLRKMPVVVKDFAGFVVNRLLSSMLDQAFRLYAAGHSIQSIDAAMRKFGFLGGPFEIVDVIGTEVCMYAGREMYDGGVNCVTLSPILPKMVKNGLQGRKTLRGFYRYESLEGSRIWDSEIDSVLADYVDDSAKFEMTDNEIANSICSCMLLEASRILEDGVVAAAKDIDICAINGFSFPTHRGGILFWADRFGVKQVNSILNQWSATDVKLTPSPLLVEKASSSNPFYRTVDA